jgi:phage shock protein A
MDYRIKVENWLAVGRRIGSAARRLLASAVSRCSFRGLDAVHRRQLDMLRPVRRSVADVVTGRKRLELQIGELERQAAEAGRASEARMRDIERRLAETRRRYAAAQAEEERVTVASRRLQAKVDDFRAGKEAVKAAYLAVEAAWAELTG